jgi:uncharacterized protein (DUF58 family)
MRLTSAGWATLGGAIAIYALGWRLGYDELLVVALAGLIALVVAFAWTWWRPSVDLDRAVVPPRVIRGEPAEARMTVTNPGRRSIPPFRARDRVGPKIIETVLPRTPAGAEKVSSVPLPTERRGVIAVGPLRVVRQDPLGLVESSRELGAGQTLWVYPRIHTVLPLASGQRRDLEGASHDGASGSITFHALREYVTGDDLRLIHWRSTARTGTLMVRQQADPSQPETTIVLDTRTDAYEGDAFEEAVEAAASLIVASTSRRFPVKLLTGSGILSSGSSGGERKASAGAPTASALLEHLTPLQTDPTGSLAAAARQLTTQRGGNSLIIVSGAPDRTDLRALENLRHRYATMAFVRFLPDADPGIAWDRGVVDVVAPTASRFAMLWNEKA